MTLEEAIGNLEKMHSQVTGEMHLLIKDFRSTITDGTPVGDVDSQLSVIAAREDRTALAIAIETMRLVQRNIATHAR